MSINVRGHCPGALTPMQTGDGLLVRLKPVCNRLSASQCEAIARLANTFGNGTLDITRRANLQLRGVHASNYDKLITALREHNLVDATADAEARRNIIVSAFAGAVGFQLAEHLAAALSISKLVLPGKFGFAIDTGEQPVLHNESADIRLERQADQTLLVRADGLQNGISVSEENAVMTMIALAEWFVTANTKSSPSQRMASLIADGCLPDEPIRGAHAPASSRLPPVPGERYDNGLFVGAEFGQISANTLIALAPFAPLMLTPWRMVLLTRTDAKVLNDNPLNARSLIEQNDDLIISADDPRLHVVACVGAPACDQALQSTRPLARELSQVMANTLNESNTLHVSGCQKGCASRNIAKLTLVATRDGFDAITDGTTLATPNCRALPANGSEILLAMSAQTQQAADNSTPTHVRT